MLDEVKHPGCIHMMSTRFFADAQHDKRRK